MDRSSTIYNQKQYKTVLNNFFIGVSIIMDYGIYFGQKWHFNVKMF